MEAFFRAICLLPALTLGILLATSPDREGTPRAEGRSAREAQQQLRFELEPAPSPDQTEVPTDDIEGRPGRENPDEFYKKPPRKPKLKTRMHA